MNKYETKVPHEGPETCELMIVGESPGEQEVRLGKPFVGRAGEELNRLLRAAGVDRTKCIVTNAYPYLPKGQDKEKERGLFPGGTPSDRLLEGMLDLAALIKQAQPNCILALGDLALWALTGERGIIKWRGTVAKSRFGPKVVATLHPAYLLRGSMHHAPLAVWDITRAAVQSKYPELVRPSRSYILPPTPEELRAYMQETGAGQFAAHRHLMERFMLRAMEAKERLLDGDHITSDTEYASADDLLCIGFTNSPGWAVVVPPDLPWSREYYESLLGCRKLKVFQNGMFDVTTLRRLGFSVRGPFADTMVGFHCCWGDIRKKDLGTISSVYTEEPYYKEELKVWGQVRDPNILYLYNAKDNAVTDEAWRGISHDMDMYQTRRSYDVQMGLFDIMAEATNFGILCDKPALMEKKEWYLSEAKKVEDAIFAVLGREINFRSPKQVAELLYDQLKIKTTKRSTDQIALMDIAATTKDPTVKGVVTAVVKSREYRNLVSRSVHEGIIDTDGRIRCSWNLAGTRNGRLSASDTYWGSGLSLQTQPDPAREFYIPDPGHAFVGFDQRQAEAFVVAYLTHDEELIEDMLNGVDIHSKLAGRLPFGITYEEIIARRKAGEDKVKERELAKKCRHGFNYQMGPYVFKNTVNKDYLENGFGITNSEAKVLYNAYHNEAPNLKLWWKRVESALRRGWMEDAFGCRRRFLGQWGDELLRDATAFYPQSTVARITTLIMTQVKERKHMGIWLMHMHDGAMAQVPEDQVQGYGQVIQDVANSIRFKVEGQDVCIPVDLKVAYSSKGQSWANMEKLKL